MSETTNYGLFVSNDDQMTFREWRLKLSGETDSNMTKIDAALGDMQGRLDNVVQADFEESNPESPAYIQNRTHWKEVVGEDREIVPQQTATFSALGWAGVEGVADGMKEGVKYVAVVGGLEIEGRCRKYGYELYIGNGHLLDSRLEDTGEGFCINALGSIYYQLTFKNPNATIAGSSLKFEMRSVQEVTYHKLDKAYLPDDLGGSDTFIVNFSPTETDGDIYADATLSDIEQAIADGKTVSGFASVDGLDFTLSLSAFDPGELALFSAVTTLHSGEDIAIIAVDIALHNSGECDIKPVLALTDEAADVTYVSALKRQDFSEGEKERARINIGVVGKAGSGENSTVFNNYDLNIASGGYSHSEGSGTEASNLTSHAEGFATRASGMASHSEGSGTEASGMAAHAEGAGSVASGGSAHAEGSNTKAYGMFSHTEGNATEAVNDNSHAQGLSTKATGRSTDVIGEFNAYESIIKDDLYSGFMETDEDKSGHTVYTFSSSDFALSEDESSIIIMNYTEKDMLYLSPGDYYVTDLDDVYTEINECVSNNSIDGSTTGGYTKYNVGYVKYTVASKSKDRGSFAHIVGNGRSENERSNAHTLDWEGNAWFAGDVYVGGTKQSEGIKLQTLITGVAGQVVGFDDDGKAIAKAGVGRNVSGVVFTVDGDVETAKIGTEIFNDYNNNIAIGFYSHAEGSNTKASGACSHAEGSNTKASGTCSHAEGSVTNASGTYSHAEGQSTTSSGMYSHAEGRGSSSTDEATHAEGYYTESSKLGSHAEGIEAKAFGVASHSEGFRTESNGDYGHAEGFQSIAQGMSSHAQGSYTRATGKSMNVSGEYNLYEIVKPYIKETSDLYTSFMDQNQTVETFKEYSLNEIGTEFVIIGSKYIGSAKNANVGYYYKPSDGNTKMTAICRIDEIEYDSDGNVRYAVTKFEIIDDATKRGSYVQVVGNGLSEETRSNAYTLDWKGNAWFAGDVYVKSTSGKNKDNGSLRLVTTEDLAEVASASGFVVWGSF